MVTTKPTTTTISSSIVPNDIINSTAPPLPPRKTTTSTTTSSSASNADTSAVNRMLKPQNNCVTSASSLVNLTNNANLSASLSKSTENLTCGEFEVPKTIAPPVPKHNVCIVKTDELDENLKRIHLTNADDQCDKVIVGPAETITGIIDTRPLEARKPIYTTMNLTTSSSSGTIDGKIIAEQIETKLIKSNTNYHELPRSSNLNNSNATNCANNLYHLKMSRSDEQPQQQQQQIQQLRHQSYPNHFQSGQSGGGGSGGGSGSTSNQQPSKSQTTSSLSQNQHRTHGMSTNSNNGTRTNHNSGNGSNSIDNGSGGGGGGGSSVGGVTPLLYENISIKDCNVPYENINLEYIARLMNEGYSKENVITALGISRNNIEMACDILHEFVSKSGA